MQDKIHIRSNSWGAANISWSVVIEELLNAADALNHKSILLSTNGYKGMKYWSREKAFKDEFYAREYLQRGNKFDIDLTYTAPSNFPQRFLPDSKCRMAIYAYESSVMPVSWRNFYPFVDFMLPPSQYCAKMMERNGCPPEKIKIVPHGVDTDMFHPNVKPMDLGTTKSFKFLCVAEPHYRKQLDKLLNVYCENFTNDDDVSLILKTKIFNDETIKTKTGFEMDLRPIVKELKKKYGIKIPEIKFISERIDNMASLYTACDAFVLMTASEGWGVPYLEALATGLPVIAPKHGGQLAFLNDSNAILTPCGERKARPQEIYWGGGKDGKVGNPDEKAFGRAMKSLWFSKSAILKHRGPGVTMMAKEQADEHHNQMRLNGLETARKLTWKNAAQQIIDIAQEHNRKSK